MIIRTIAVLLCAGSLAACVANESPQPPRNPNPASEMAPAGQDPGRVVGSTAEEDCRFAVATQLGVDESVVSVLGSSMGENFTTVMVNVPSAEAPWACEWGGNGVSNIYYSGSEGAL